MTAARLSPAASLLRNSKLFSIPPTLALPPQEASSETIAHSDTATTPFPVRAAIETPQLSLNKGDWGLKRSLPLQTTTKTGTPVIRVQRGLDTPEHTVDFESAADHVLTLQKWQHLHIPIQYPSGVNTGYDDQQKHGVFNSSKDNTTNISDRPWTGLWPNLSPEDRALHVPTITRKEGEEFKRVKMEGSGMTEIDPPAYRSRPAPSLKSGKRWRYQGPWLAGMSGLEFDEFLKKHVRNKRAAFRQKVEAQWRADIETAAKSTAAEDGTIKQEIVKPADGASVAESSGNAFSTSVSKSRTMSEDEYNKYLRALRRRPEVFGPLIAEFLDLPEGPKAPTAGLASRKGQWEYNRNTLAAPSYRNTGPPRTHPSAGLSYSRSRNWAANDARFGPQNDLTPVVGRILKFTRSGGNSSATVGVAGFVAPRMDRIPARDNRDLAGFTSRPGGQKLLVVPNAAMVNVDGMLDLHVRHAPATHILENDEAVRQEARKLPETSKYGKEMPKLDIEYKKATPLPQGYQRKIPDARRGGDTAAVLEMLDKMEREENSI